MDAHSKDQELALRVAGGDADAFGEVYDLYAHKVTAIAARFVGAERAPDVVHDIFLEFWEKAIDFDASRGTLMTWLAVRTRSRSIDDIRKRTRRQNLLTENEGATRPREITPPSERAVERSRLREAIAELEPEFLEVIELAYYEGISTSEISEVLNIPQGTVKSRMRRAREALASVIVGEGL